MAGQALRPPYLSACSLSVPSLQTVTRRPKVAPAERMSKFLRHFTVVGDDYHTWNINYKKWENEEEEEEEEQAPPAPASGEEGRAAEPTAARVPAPRPPLDFRTMLRKLFSCHRFQVGGQRPEMPGAGERAELSARVTRPAGGPSATASLVAQMSPERRPCAGHPTHPWVPWAGPVLSGVK